MYSLVLWLKLQALQIKFQPSFNHSRLLFQVLYLLMFSLKVKLAGVHASFPFYCCFGTLLFWLMYNHKRLSCHSDIVSRFDLQFMLKDRHLMPGAVSCLCVCVTSRTGPPTSTGPNPSLDILGLLQLGQETH